MIQIDIQLILDDHRNRDYEDLKSRMIGEASSWGQTMPSETRMDLKAVDADEPSGPDVTVSRWERPGSEPGGPTEKLA